MAHKAQINYVNRIREKYPNKFRHVSVLDIGSRDINGNNRQFFSTPEYTGIDVWDGDNVDVVCKGHEFDSDNYFDTVISTECLEYDPYYAETLKNMVRLTRPGGLMLFTCATTGRPEHGTTRTETYSNEGTAQMFDDYYKNLTETDIRDVLDLSQFETYQFDVDRGHSDLYFHGIKKRMKIDFIISHLGLFGSVRELIENGNNLSRLGHDVTVWTAEGTPCKWLYQNFRTKSYQNQVIDTDVLILMDSPQPDQFRFFSQSNAKFKTMIMMGFEPDNFHLYITPETYDNLMPHPEATVKNLHYILRNYEMCADGQWQLDYMAKYGVKTGVAIGGINTSMFYPIGVQRKGIIISGDHRERKGTPILEQALKGLKYTRYAGTNDQDELRMKLASALIYVDNHTRAGWVNPVLEAMACGCAVVCSELGANRDFAINGETAIVVPKNDVKAFRAGVDELINNPNKRLALSAAAVRKALEWDYHIVTKRFEQYLYGKVS